MSSGPLSTPVDATPAAASRLSAGVPRLDQILGGGLPADGITILAGAPGTGKTILAQQYAFHNGTEDRPAVYLSTVSEPLEKILRYGQSLDYFDPAAVGGAIIYGDLGELLVEGGLPEVRDHIVAQIKRHRPRLIAIDSFKALADFAEDRLAFRRFLHELAGWLSAFPTSCLWVGEYDEADITARPEFAVADAVVQLTTQRTLTRQIRSLRIAKLRGSAFASGLHTYRITPAGLDVYPRLADVPEPSDYEIRPLRRSSGVEAIDEMLLDGYWEGSSTLCAGPSGTGKTLMGLHFVVTGARAGERSIVATLQENETQLQRMAEAFGWSLHDPNIEVMYRSPVDIHIDQWACDLLDALDRTGAARVLIDSLADLRFAAGEDIRFREFMYSLTQRCSRRGVSLFMTSETSDLFHLDRLADNGISHLSDNVVLLQYARGASAIERTLTILKTRASRHEHGIRPFTIDRDGIRLA